MSFPGPPVSTSSPRSRDRGTSPIAFGAEPVDSRTAVERVVAVVSDKRVVTVVAAQRIAASPTFDPVHSGAPASSSAPAPPYSSSAPGPPATLSTALARPPSARSSANSSSSPSPPSTSSLPRHRRSRRDRCRRPRSHAVLQADQRAECGEVGDAVIHVGHDDTHADHAVVGREQTL